MTPQKQIINLAFSQVGYHEKDSAADLDNTDGGGSGNYTKYARDLDAVPGYYNGQKQGYAWCDVFVDWLFVQCFGADVGRRMLYQPLQSAGAGCTYSYQYFKAAGALYHEPKPGDQIFFGSTTLSTHTGIVVDVDADTVYTVEGNSGDAVQKRAYKLGSSNIVGYGRPDWSLAAESAGPAEPEKPEQKYEPLPTDAEKLCVVMLPELSNGSTGRAVAAMQFLLDRFGFQIGRWGIDGEFGQDTQRAVLQFQARNGLDQDGIVGTKTWEQLLT